MEPLCRSLYLWQQAAPARQKEYLGARQEVASMAAGTTQPTNEELIERLRAAGHGTPGAAEIIGELWEKNAGLVRLTVHKLTGLNPQEPGFEDMEQQAYFGFHSAAYAYSPAAGIKFSTYAAKRIQWELCRYYENNGFTVRIPAFMKRRLRECMRKKRELEADAGRPVTYEDALKALGLSPAAVSGTLAAFRKLETASLDELHGSDDGDSVSLLDRLAAGEDVEEDALSQEWHRELHELLFAALQDIPADTRGAIIQHYFGGQSFEQLAHERGITPQTLYNRRSAAFRSIRAGKHAAALAEYMPSTSSRTRAERRIKADREAVEQLRLTETERGLLAL